jgi:hypothetical protein
MARGDHLAGQQKKSKKYGKIMEIQMNEAINFADFFRFFRPIFRIFW